MTARQKKVELDENKEFMTDMQTLTRFRIREPDSAEVIAQAREEGKVLALQLGFAPPRVLMVTTVISELARNIVMYAHSGEIRLGLYSNGKRSGLSITAWDEGPGIADLDLAMLSGYSTSGNPGLGLPGVNRIADEFKIESRPGHTLVRAIFWGAS
jgi:serine/threonine-protein kinase RsbT